MFMRVALPIAASSVRVLLYLRVVDHMNLSCLWHEATSLERSSRVVGVALVGVAAVGVWADKLQSRSVLVPF